MPKATIICHCAMCEKQMVFETDDTKRIHEGFYFNGQRKCVGEVVYDQMNIFHHYHAKSDEYYCRDCMDKAHKFEKIINDAIENFLLTGDSFILHQFVTEDD
jgi:hypothetical protein